MGAKWKSPGPVISKFLLSDKFVRGIMGPLGSGKSTACTIEILRKSMNQAKGSDGRRHVRWAVIRNSYPELKSTTMKTWFDWCPQEYGKCNFDSPIIHHVKTAELDMEILFLALDRPEDIKKLLSLELTGAWVNEAREIPKAIIDTLTGRVGRYPSMAQGGCTWSGIIMDTNPPDSQSPWYKFAEEECPKDWEFFKQPGARDDGAENLENLIPNYYKRIIQGKDPDWVKVYIDGQYGFLIEGQPVYPMFRDRTHISDVELEPWPGFAIFLGIDYGLTPCAIMGQKLPNGRWIIVDEFVTDDCGVRRFAELLTTYMSENYINFDWVAFGDPAGDYRGQEDEDTCKDIMNTYCPYKVYSAPTNDLTMRLEVVKNTLNRMVDGDPGLSISPKCRVLRKGFNGAYHYKLIKTSGGTRTQEKPNKNYASHPHDALQYLLLGGGEQGILLNTMKGDLQQRFRNSPRMLKQIERVRQRASR